MKHEDDPRFEIKNKVLVDGLNNLATALTQVIPKGWGFAIQVFEFGEGKSFFYISNAERDTMMQALREFIQREAGN